jgi:hypothetical protein
MTHRFTTETTLLVCLLATSLSSVALAQDRRTRAIPPGHLPPPGECRVWYDNRAAGHQPPPTDCASARREARRTGGRVIFGGNERRDDRDRRRDDDDWRRECDAKDREKGECDWDDTRCVDRNGDGWCDDDGRRRRDDCVDRDRDGRCDYGAEYPSSLPEMVWGIIFGRGERVDDDVRRWLGTGGVRPKVTDANGNGVPEVVTWTDAQGRVLQRWIDDNRDGRADRVGIYENGRVVRVIR